MESVTFKNQAAQGDCLITRVNEIPAGFSKIEVNENDYAVAHSESGHHHVMSTKTVDFYTAANDPFVIYLAVKNETPIRHLRNFDTHKTISVPAGLYRINRQREYTPEGFRRAAD